MVGGMSKLGIDDSRLGSAGGKTDCRSTDYDQSEGRYDVEIGARASKPAIGRQAMAWWARQSAT
jgi:hypothetical protein